MIHTITPGFYCVPTVIQALTGEDMLSVIIPCLNRQAHAPWLLEEVIEVPPHIILKALNVLGYQTLRYKKALGTVETWKDRYPNETMLLMTRDHVVIIYQGTIYDNHTPTGKTALNHPFSADKVEGAYMIRKMS